MSLNEIKDEYEDRFNAIKEMPKFQRLEKEKRFEIMDSLEDELDIIESITSKNALLKYERSKLNEMQTASSRSEREKMATAGKVLGTLSILIASMALPPFALFYALPEFFKHF